MWLNSSSSVLLLNQLYVAVGAQGESLIILSLLIDVRLGLIRGKVVKTFVDL